MKSQHKGISNLVIASITLVYLLAPVCRSQDTDAPFDLASVTAQADGGDGEAALRLARVYEMGKHGLEVDQEKAVHYFESAGNAGVPQGHYAIAEIFYRGLGGRKKDYYKSYRHYALAAEAGHLKAKANFGALLEMGRGGKKDVAQAVQYYKEAAESGLAKAQFNYARALKEGKYVDKDYKLAAEYFQKSIDGGFKKALNHLAEMYLDGDGVEPDFFTAMTLYKKSAEHGDEFAEMILDRFKENYGDINDYEYTTPPELRKQGTKQDL